MRRAVDSAPYQHKWPRGAPGWIRRVFESARGQAHSKTLRGTRKPRATSAEDGLLRVQRETGNETPYVVCYSFGARVLSLTGVQVQLGESVIDGLGLWC